MENVTSLPVQYDADETGHPTVTGTVQILNQVNDHSNTTAQPLIWNAAFIATEKAYSCVESVFRYGCNCCKGYGLQLKHSRHNNQLVCDECYDSLDENGNDLLRSITERVTAATALDSDNAFPALKRARTADNNQATEDEQ